MKTLFIILAIFVGLLYFYIRMRFIFESTKEISVESKKLPPPKNIVDFVNQYAQLGGITADWALGRTQMPIRLASLQVMESILLLACALGILAYAYLADWVVGYQFWISMIVVLAASLASILVYFKNKKMGLSQ